MQNLLKMYQGKYVFARITEFLPRRIFDDIVQKYDGNKHIRTFTCWNQMLCMVFGQLTTRDSLRDLISVGLIPRSSASKNNTFLLCE